jgi:hypothetical protein
MPRKSATIAAFLIDARMADAQDTADSPRQWNTTGSRPTSRRKRRLIHRAFVATLRRPMYGRSRTRIEPPRASSSLARARARRLIATRAGSIRPTITRAGRPMPGIVACTAM